MMVYFIILENRCEGPPPIPHNIAENLKLRDLFCYKKLGVCCLIFFNEILHAHIKLVFKLGPIYLKKDSITKSVP